MLNHDEFPKAVFTRADYDTYLDRLIPYREKVLDRKEILDLKDITDLEQIAAELDRVYSPQSLASSGINASFAILDINEQRLDWARQQTLDKEYSDLSQRLQSEQLTPDEKKAIYGRISRIRYILEPEHYFGPPPS